MSDVRSTGKGWMTEDLHFNLVNGPERYVETTIGPVEYAPVAAGEQIYGYLWFRDEDDAADFIPRSDAGRVAQNAAVAWTQELQEAKKNGDRPSQAITRLAREAGSSRIGWVDLTKKQMVSGLVALQALANN